MVSQNYSFKLTEMVVLFIFWSLKLCLRSMCVCVAPFHVLSKVCIAPFYVRSKDGKFAPHLEGINAEFAPHIEGSHADFALHMERRHSFRDQQIAKIAIFASYFFFLFLKHLKLM